MNKIIVLHENNDWVAPLASALDRRSARYALWHMSQGRLDLSSSPPEGVYYARMSASAHTRGHRYAPEYTAAVLAWIEAHGRRVVNGSRALRLELSKAHQYQALAQFGIRTPRTVVAADTESLVAAAGQFDGPVIVKPNRAGKGLGVRLFSDSRHLAADVKAGRLDGSVDGLMLVQEYVEAPEPYITRMEFIGGKFFYAVRVDTSEGFELCPADACEIEPAFCATSESAGKKFEILGRFENPDLPAYESLLAANEVEIAGIEFIRDRDGNCYTYDININTNYNRTAEEQIGRYGMESVADFLMLELERQGDASIRQASVA